MEWWLWLIVAVVGALVWAAYAWQAGYNRGRADGWDQRKELYR